MLFCSGRADSYVIYIEIHTTDQLQLGDNNDIT